MAQEIRTQHIPTHDPASGSEESTRSLPVCVVADQQAPERIPRILWRLRSAGPLDASRRRSVHTTVAK